MKVFDYNVFVKIIQVIQKVKIAQDFAQMFFKLGYLPFEKIKV